MNFNHILLFGLSYIYYFNFTNNFPFNHELQGEFGPFVYQNADSEYMYTKDLIF